jgi:hypothetical protein
MRFVRYGLILWCFKERKNRQELKEFDIHHIEGVGGNGIFPGGCFSRKSWYRGNKKYIEFLFNYFCGLSPNDPPILINLISKP